LGHRLCTGLSLWTSFEKITFERRPLIRMHVHDSRLRMDGHSTQRSALADSMADGMPSAGRPQGASDVRQMAGCMTTLFV
jgi:hypothetical protein